HAGVCFCKHTNPDPILSLSIDGANHNRARLANLLMQLIVNLNNSHSKTSAYDIYTNRMRSISDQQQNREACKDPAQVYPMLFWSGNIEESLQNSASL